MVKYFFEKQGSLVWVAIPEGAAQMLKESTDVGSKGALARKIFNKNKDKAITLSGVPAESAVESSPFVATLGNKGL
jgi:hypothetical protein